MRTTRMKMLGSTLCAALAALAAGGLLTLAGCKPNGSSTATAPDPSDAEPTQKDRYVIGMVAKSDSNPVYLAARAGAEAAAQELRKAHDVQIELVWRSPSEEDSARQNQLVGELVSTGVDGLAVSCTDAAAITPAIDQAVAAGVQVVTFDADAPDSRRIAFYGIDDQKAGAALVEMLADEMGESGRVAVLAGNRASQNIWNRVLGATRELSAHEGMEIVGVFHHHENPEAANLEMRRAHERFGPIDGWVLVGGWPLYDPAGLEGVPEGTKIVSMDPLPPALDHAEAGHVLGFLAQPYYGWGHESVSTLFARLHEGTAPEPPVRLVETEVVTPDSYSGYREQWVEWIGKPNGG